MTHYWDGLATTSGGGEGVDVNLRGCVEFVIGFDRLGWFVLAAGEESGANRSARRIHFFLAKSYSAEGMMFGRIRCGKGAWGGRAWWARSPVWKSRLDYMRF